MESSFLELKCKDVINVTDGKKLGRISDIVFDLPSGRVNGFVVPMISGGFSLFKSSQNIFVPYNQICKIGTDTILVEVFSDDQSVTTYALNEPQKSK